MANFVSEEHALQAGKLIGVLMRESISVKLITDDAGNYTPELEIEIPHFSGHGFELVRLQVLPPID